MKTGKTILAALAGALSLGAVLSAAPAPAGSLPAVEVWKSPSCGCCGGWIRHMQDAGFTVEVHETDELEPVKRSLGIPPELASCHTARVGGYVVEGHVPAADVRRLLAEKPAAAGLSVPGMPMDAPGMDMGTGQPYEVVLFGAAGGEAVFARH